jgi:hypothetical protein
VDLVAFPQLVHDLARKIEIVCNDSAMLLEQVLPHRTSPPFVVFCTWGGRYAKLITAALIFVILGA